jgi:phage tail sheath protein FI
LLASLTDSKQDFDMFSTAVADLPHQYCVTITDQRGNKLKGWIGGVDATGTSVEIFNSRLNTTTQSWIGDITKFDETGDISYEVKKSFAKVSDAFLSATPTPLRKGSDGSLRNSQGDLDTATATQLLSQAYTGQITSKVDAITAVDDILDNENIYFSVVFDAGYPDDVKTKIVELCQTRRDAVNLIDNGDNSNFNAAMAARVNNHVFNNYFTAIYESYNKVYDSFTGQDVWFSPVYHMSYLLPRNDNVAEIWWAVAGFNRAPIENIKELRYSPKLGQRDQMYLKQLNPIVKFANGYTVWGQLTSQSKPSALQDLNIVRLVLYIKRALEQYSRFFIFELNDAMTWSRVAGNINEFLESIKKKRGLYSYSCEVGATEYEKKTKTFHINVTLEPTRVVEKIELNFFIK